MIFNNILNKFSQFRKTVSDKVFILYILKCIIGTALCYALYFFFPNHRFNWSIISVLLVLAPDKHDSDKLAFDRMKANITGASIGLFSFLICIPNIITLILSVITTILICTFIQLGSASRSALAALVIVMVEEKELTTWQAATDRMMCVIAGCLIAILITYLSHYKEKNGSISNINSDE